MFSRKDSKTNSGSEKNVGSRKSDKKKIGSNKFWIGKNFGSKNFLGPIYFVLQKMLAPKNQNMFGPKVWVQKKIYI